MTKLKDSLYSFFDYFLLRYGRWRAKQYDIENTIVLSSSGRSGSTWLAEIVETIPGYHIIYEPFHMGHNPKCKNVGLSWNNYITPNEEAIHKKNYISKILDGRELSTRTLRRHHLRPMRLLQLEGYVVKSINANMMLTWMCDRFPVKAVLLLRHPCAVVSSQLNSGGWDWAANKDAITIPDRLFEDRPRLAELFGRLSSKEQNLAFIWGMQNVVPLQQDGRWTLTTYERLVEDRERELRRIFSYLDRPMPDSAIEQSYRESSSGSSYSGKEDLLADWKRRLSSEQVSEILDIVHRMGIMCYTDDLHPDYSQLPL